MARPKKIGLDYFPVDVQFDQKIEAIELLFGNNGLAWVVKFWQEAYQTEQGQINLSGLFGELFAKKCRTTIEEHKKILETALSVKFCEETVQGSCVYTSNGIKKRIAAVSEERKSAIKRKEERKSKVKETPHCSANNSDCLENNRKSDEKGGFIEITEEDRLKMKKEAERIGECLRKGENPAK
jgi:hypothetical protein